MGEMKAEEKCIVLDYMPTGKASAIKTEAIAQVLGKEYFTLLEVTPKLGKGFTVGEEIYVGKEERDKVELIKGRISFKELTSNSLSELEDIVTDIVDAQKEKFLKFINSARAISLKRHQLELLPGMGKKHMIDVLDERDKKPFESFEDVPARVKGVPEIKKAVIKRIIEELEGPDDKHYLFVRPPAAPRKFYPQRRRY
jgi:putative nucleotide binding protein